MNQRFPSWLCNHGNRESSAAIAAHLLRGYSLASAVSATAAAAAAAADIELDACSKTSCGAAKVGTARQVNNEK
jgi:hypothetical protein